MAIFDVGQQRMCVRVVYDGVASAGKTTNVRQLAELFATQRTCEAFSPGEADGRTLYFDWLQITAGMACGFPLVCQVISVPGQLVLSARRRHLLATADVVVHVCDSDETAVLRAASGLALFDAVESERGERIPLVVQANKQDQPRALSGAAILAALGRTAPVVEAIASDGIGVVDTFVAAVRTVVRSLEAQIERGICRVAVDVAETAEAVLEKLEAEEVDPEWAAEMYLEELSNMFTFGEENSAGPSIDVLGVVSARVDPRVPELPSEHVPTGFVWPAHTGRAALRTLGAEAANARFEIGADGGVRVTCGALVLTTGPEGRFDTAESARQALVRTARERAKLGALLAPETVLVAQPSGAATTWLWTILPQLPTVAELLAAGTQAPGDAHDLLGSYGTALVETLELELANGGPLDLSPHGFGVRDGGLCYVGALNARDLGDQRPRDLGRALEDALVSLSLVCDDLEPAVSAIEAALVASLSSGELAKLADAATFREPTTLPVAVRAARSRLEELLARGRRAA